MVVALRYCCFFASTILVKIKRKSRHKITAKWICILLWGSACAVAGLVLSVTQEGSFVSKGMLVFYISECLNFARNV